MGPRQQDTSDGFMDHCRQAQALLAAGLIGVPGSAPMPRAGSLAPERATGLEFDLVVPVNPRGVRNRHRGCGGPPCGDDAGDRRTGRPHRPLGRAPDSRA
ncbi:hypothetical protein GCM10023166_32820 [Paeniglutamicibacter cryotolerans]|uniref:Uncharacterized protein n=1 Tax=Paeniglutamicibacter cryotolerans TaxID=670079 RepID=A0A839QEN0_9MICC|nr:hypothetical protein [Paeniglutamicibacter cryotolerans]MBB2994087.1 hypothetical protein [Paeniglutamicibacter cryotolerans]